MIAYFYNTKIYLPRSGGGCIDFPAPRADIMVAVFPRTQPTPAKAIENATMLNGCCNTKDVVTIWTKPTLLAYSRNIFIFY